MDLRVIGRFLEVLRQESILALNSLRFFDWKMVLKEKTQFISFLSMPIFKYINFLIL